MSKKTNPAAVTSPITSSRSRTKSGGGAHPTQTARTRAKRQSDVEELVANVGWAFLEVIRVAERVQDPRQVMSPIAMTKWAEMMADWFLQYIEWGQMVLGRNLCNPARP